MYSNKRWIFIRRNGSSDKSRPRATRACKSTTSPSRLTPFIVGHCKRHPRSSSMVIRRDNGVHQETCHENGISAIEREREGGGFKKQRRTITGRFHCEAPSVSTYEEWNARLRTCPVPHSRRNNKNTTRGDRGSGCIRLGRGNGKREGASRAFFALIPLEKSILPANSKNLLSYK